ncbi:kinetochore protein SPC25-like [Citrus sinensis]|uniref:kinetochore protein SPC25 homolog isoform X1 n=1 Tax=Citrus sinensis TaxID=2711 RepID=UPI000CED2F37|nr:kinetochore protein SPC25 homolog isoform X1 [Citrus sinensis]XP_024045141.1 kinetochore protein spc25 isoform X1 [Citrus x clementina]KAH9720367.1 kinetochore protein SPC25-like [Citrus sinensis]
MESSVEDSVRTKMESMRVICDREITINEQKMDSVTASFLQSLESIKAKARATVQNQSKLEKMKADLRKAEDELVKVLAVKTRKEAKQMATRDSISVTKARLEELKRNVEAQRARRDEYSAIISQQSLALATTAEKTKQDLERKGQIQQAISWYNRVLGFHIEGGHGVRFTFSNINMKNPNEGYSFTIRHADDTYTLLYCDPPLNDIKELIQELNRTNGLFKFVRIMREKFEEAATVGLSSQSSTLHQDSCTISVSAPSFSVSTDRSESPAKTNEYQIQRGEVNRQVNEVIHGHESPTKKNQLHIQHGEVSRQSKKANHGRNVNPALLSPGSASTPRRSTRIKDSNLSLGIKGEIRLFHTGFDSSYMLQVSSFTCRILVLAVVLISDVI